MPKLYAKQLAALDALKKLDPNLSIEWDEDTGTPSIIRGLLSPPAPPIAPQLRPDAAREAAYAFLRENKALYRLRDPDQEFPNRRVVSDELGSTVHVYQLHQGVEVFDGELSIALDPQNRVTQILGRYRPTLRLSTEPVVSPDQAIEIALADLDVADKDLAPITHRLLIVNTHSFLDVAAKRRKRNRLSWRVELLTWVYFVDARDGSVIFTYDNTQTLLNRETYSSTDCRVLPGTLWITEDGAVAGQPVDDIARSAHRHAGMVYDFYFDNFGLDSFDGRGRRMVSTVHSGINNGFFCDQNNAAFIPVLSQIVYGDGDGTRFGPFANALDVVAHEWQHAVTYFAITWADGSPRGLDYRDESGALNESYSDFFGSLVEDKDWFMGEDCYTPLTPDDALRDLTDPARYGQPDHYSGYVNSGTQSYRVHVNSGIMNKCAYLMSEGGTHHGVMVTGMGKEEAGRVWYRALRHHLQGASTFKDARQAMLQSCQELFPSDTVKYATVQDAFAAVGIGEPAAGPRIVVEPTHIGFGAVSLGQSAQETLTVRNTGTADLAVSDTQSSDPAFSVIGDTAFTLAPGASQALTVQFSPISEGEQQANLTIQSNDSGQPTLTVALSGSGVGVPRIAVEPTQIDFGTVAIGQSAKETLTVRNTGTAELVVSDVQSSDPAFSVSGETAFALAPGASQALTVQFSPPSGGEQQANLAVQSNDGSQLTVVVALSGTGVGMPLIAVEPTQIDFGTVTLGQSAQETLTVRNSGTGDLAVSDVQSGDPAFSVVGDTAFQLAPGASETLSVQFSPTAVGQRQANLTIQSDDSIQPTVSVALSGTGLGVPRIAVEPTRIDFDVDEHMLTPVGFAADAGRVAGFELGEVVVGGSAQRPLTVRNNGSADLAVSAIESSHPAFTIVGDSAFQLAPGASKTLGVKFSPTSAGLQQGNLTIHSNDSSQPTVTVALSGTGIVPRMTVQPTTIDFGTLTLGQSAQQTLTVRNAGTADLTVSDIESSDPAFFVVGDTAFQLAPEAFQTLTVQFSPTSMGQQQANLTIHSNDSSQPAVTVALSGTAVGVSNIVVEPTSIDFGTVTLGQSAQEPLEVRNTGTAALTVSDIVGTDPAFSVVGDTAFPLAPGASQRLTIQFSPTSAGQQQASLTIHSNDSSRPTVSVALSGTGASAPAIAAEPEALDFASVVIGDSNPLSLTIHNVGGSRLLVSDMSVDQPAFDVVGDTALQLDPGTAQAIVIRFTPAVEGHLQATLSIVSNDPKWPTFSITLTGVGERVPVEGPHIVLDPQQLSFGAVPVGQAARRDVTVKNSGKSPLTINRVHTDSSVYTVLGETPSTVAPFVSHIVTVQYEPTAQGAHGGTLSFFSNDPQQPETSVVLFGTATRCFVATAAYGSPLQREVRTLRNFRDHSLIGSPLGRTLVALYYRWNDRAADLVAHSQVGRTAARWMLRPLVALARFATRPERGRSEQANQSPSTKRKTH